MRPRPSRNLYANTRRERADDRGRHRAPRAHHGRRRARRLGAPGRLSTHHRLDRGNADTWVITNNSASVIDTHLLVVLTNLASGVSVEAASKTTCTALAGGTSSGEPGRRAVLPHLPARRCADPGQSVSVTVTRIGGGSSSSHTPKLLSGQGRP
jgi:hypothetical protein